MTFAVELRSVGGKLCTLIGEMALAEGTRLGPYEIVAPLAVAPRRPTLAAVHENDGIPRLTWLSHRTSRQAIHT